MGGGMKSLSVRGIDVQLAAILKKRAGESKKSVNQFVLEVLRKHVGLEKEKRFTRVYSDLDELFGKWSEEDYSLIQGKIDTERQVDTELWK